MSTTDGGVDWGRFARTAAVVGFVTAVFAFTATTVFEGDLLTLAVGAIGAVGIVTAITAFLIAAASRLSDEGQATPPTEPEGSVGSQESTSAR
jgi:hypothetical protein